MKYKVKNKKVIIIIAVSIIILILLFLFVKSIFFQDGSDKYGDRCSDRDDYKISSETIKKAEDKIKEISEVDDIEIYSQLCTIKIIINLDDDVDLDIIKEKAKEVLDLFSEEELSYYDFALFVTSNNKDSKVYPINVSKHNSREDFAW